MLFVIIGTDPKARLAARHKLWKGALEDIDAGADFGELAARAGTHALFGGAQAFWLQGVFADAERGEAFSDHAETLADSPHVFILEEEKLLAAPKAALKKAGAEIIELKPAEKKEPFNVFALANALGKKDRKSLWLGLMRAAEEDVAPENVAGILAWKARTMLAGAKDESDRKELAKLSRELVMMYHDAHRGAGDLALLLERFALTL